jgi:hypothetical protein
MMFMKSRMAITMMLVLGLLLTTAGAGLATSGVGDDAGRAQYPTERPTTTPTLQPQAPPQAPAPAPAPAVAPLPAAPAPAVPAPQPESAVLDESVESPAPAAQPEADAVAPAQEQAAPAQAPRQVVAQQSTDSLPFTGFAALPVLLAGVALLVTGATLRLRSR